ncbi:MAG: hypothetical protein INR69_20950, partial [Mucilaginibacter polytrichastri]|nr:hypothetical protein [Mucilaginibacter polytrichastri]
MKRILALIGILVLAVAGVSWLYFSSLQNKTTGTTQIIRALQPDALFAYSFYNEKEYSEIFRNNSLFVSVTGRDALNELQSLRNFVDQKSTLKQAFNGMPVVISLHMDSVKKQTSWMISTSLPQAISWNDMLKIFTRYGKLKEQGTIYVLEVPQLGRPLFISRKKSIIAVSFALETVNNFAQNTEENTFTQLGDQQNRNSLAGLSVNYRLLPALRKMTSKNRSNLFFDLLPAVSGSSATTITYNQTALLFNGVTYLDENDRGPVS